VTRSSPASHHARTAILAVAGWLACLALLPGAASAQVASAQAESVQAGPEVEAIRRARLRGALDEARQMAERRLAEPELPPADRVALHLELARIHDRYGLHHNTRPVAAAMAHVEAAAREAGADAADLLAAIELARAEMMYRAEMDAREFPSASEHGRRAVELFQQLGDRHGEAEAVHRLGLVELQRRNLGEARLLFEESRELDIAGGERPFFQGEYERHIAFVELFEGDVAAAIPHLQRSLELRRQSGAIDASMFAANTLASALVTAGRAGEARQPLLYAMTVAESLASPVGRARNGLVAGRLYAALGDTAAAVLALEQVVRLADSLHAQSLGAAAEAALDRLRDPR
jgi:tetratricopeptide (TPR) repeat protein